MFKKCCGWSDKDQKSGDEEEKEALKDSKDENIEKKEEPKKTEDVKIEDVKKPETKHVVVSPEIRSPGLRVNTEIAASVRSPGAPAADEESCTSGDTSSGLEGGGMAEPPVTPVGRDELALKRHRFFADLMAASQDTHRVRFDPRGPSFSGESEGEIIGRHTNELDVLVSRLEVVTNRLEETLNTVQTTSLSAAPSQELLDTSSPSPVINMSASVAGFRDVLDGPFASYLALSQKIGGHVGEQAALVKDAFYAQLSYLEVAASRGEPSQNEQVSLLGPTSSKIQAIQELREKNRTSTYFNHLSAISESIPALGWVTIKPAPSPYIKEMSDAGQFYTNRVLKDWKEKDRTHVEWVKAWLTTLSELQKFVKQVHTTGLVWAAGGARVGGAAPPPPPGGMPPPPPPIGDLSLDGPAGGDDRSALFAQINQGENITQHLKRVTPDMQTHKNPGLRSGPAPFKAPLPSPTAVKPTSNSKQFAQKDPVFTRDGKKWLIEHHKGNHNLLVEGAEMNNVVYVYGCADSTVTVKGKVNSIFLDSCKKTAVVFDSLVSSVEFVNCQSVQMQVLGTVPTISIDKTDGCQMYLSKDSLKVEIVSSKSSEMNVLVPKPDGEFVEYPIPEQYKTVLKTGGLETTPVENKG